MDPKNANYWSLMGNTLQDLGLYLEAITAWNMVMSIEPTFKTAIVMARVALAIKDKVWAAESLVMSLVHRGDNPSDIEDYLKLLEIYEKL
jgi:tetratricopeptide (TPR) repeat protein